MTLKELRMSKGLTQSEIANLCSVSLRSYKTYENDESKIGTIKYRFFVDFLNDYGIVDETHGILSVEEIESKVAAVLSGYDVSYCYLFGSYAKGSPTESSDVDLLISTAVTGLQFYGIAEKLRNILNKKVELLDYRQLGNNPELLNEILKDGLKLYG